MAWRVFRIRAESKDFDSLLEKALNDLKDTGNLIKDVKFCTDFVALPGQSYGITMFNALIFYEPIVEVIQLPNSTP